jgi:hypothetical protein
VMRRNRYCSAYIKKINNYSVVKVLSGRPPASSPLSGEACVSLLSAACLGVQLLSFFDKATQLIAGSQITHTSRAFFLHWTYRVTNIKPFVILSCDAQWR